MKMKTLALVLLSFLSVIPVFATEKEAAEYVAVNLRSDMKDLDERFHPGVDDVRRQVAELLDKKYVQGSSTAVLLDRATHFTAPGGYGGPGGCVPSWNRVEKYAVITTYLPETRSRFGFTNDDVRTVTLVVSYASQKVGEGFTSGYPTVVKVLE